MRGPPPKPPGQARHRNKTTLATALVQLPSEGRAGDPPAWPLSRARKAELAVWVSLWRLPQAIVWERQESQRAVARYVRLLVDAEKAGAAASLLAEVRQMEDRLGLSPMAMLRLRWTIVADEMSDQRAAEHRERIRAVDPNQASAAE